MATKTICFLSIIEKLSWNQVTWKFLSCHNHGFWTTYVSKLLLPQLPLASALILYDDSLVLNCSLLQREQVLLLHRECFPKHLQKHVVFFLVIENFVPSVNYNWIVLWLLRKSGRGKRSANSFQLACPLVAFEFADFAKQLFLNEDGTGNSSGSKRFNVSDNSSSHCCCKLKGRQRFTSN